MAEVKVIGNIYNNILKGIQEKKTLIALQGSARSGKTRNTVIFLIQIALERKLRISIVRASLPVLKRSVFRDDFQEVMMQMGIWNGSRMNKTEMVYTFENGSVIEFFATDGPEGAQKARGPGRDVLFCNEANEIDEENFKQMRMRTRMFSIIDFNPSFTEEHWIFKILQDERTYYFKSTFRENVFLSDAIRQEIESYRYTNPALWEIFGCGNFAIVEGLVFPKDSWDICEKEDIPYWVKDRRIGIDFGYTNDPTAIVDCYFARIDNIRHLWVDELCYAKGLKTKQIAFELKPYNDVMKFSESADPRLIDELNDEGIQMLYPVKKYAGSLIVGVQKLQGYKIHVTKRSTNIQKELRNYCFQKDRHEQMLNVPIDKFNHAIDAIRYAASDERNNAECNGGLFLEKEDLGLYW